MDNPTPRDTKEYPHWNALSDTDSDDHWAPSHHRSGPAEWVDSGLRTLGAYTRQTQFYRILPAWLQEGLVSRRTWKTWFRIMIANLVAILMLVIQPALRHIGGATFFTLVAIEIFQPAMPPMIYAFGMALFGIGGLWGWAWGDAAMASGLSASSSARFRRQMAEFAATLKPGQNRVEAFTTAIQRGKFMDPGRSAVFAVFLFLGAYFLGWVRATRPKLILFFVMGSIELSLMCTFGVLSPVKSYMLGKELLTPLGVSLGISLATSVLIFPQSLNSACLDLIANRSLKSIRLMLKLHDRLLGLEVASPDDEDFNHIVQGVKTLRSGFLDSMTGLNSQMGLIQLEVSRGRTSPGQIQAVAKEVKTLGERVLALAALTIMIKEDHQTLAAWERHAMTPMMRREEGKLDAAQRRVEDSGRALKQLIPSLGEATQELRSAIRDALTSAVGFLNMINHTRWPWNRTHFPPDTRHQDLTRLKAALDDFRSKSNAHVIAPFADMFDASGRLNPKNMNRVELVLCLRSLFRCFAFTTSLVALSLQLVSLLEHIESIDARSPKAKIQIPEKFFAAIGRNLADDGGQTTDHGFKAQNDLLDTGPEKAGYDSDDADTASDVGEMNEKSTSLKKKNSKEKKEGRRAKKVPLLSSRDPDAGPPQNVIQKFCRFVRRIVHGLFSLEGIFALRMGLTSIICYIPAVAPASAGFYSRNRGIWALIMSQTGMSMEAGEQIWSAVTKVAGTAAGMVTGIVVWYSGDGRGRGSPYGFTCVLLVALAPLIFIRLVAPKSQSGFWTMWPLTTCLISGYSWDDNHLPTSSSQGAGAEMAGRRGLLVVIGFGVCTLTGLVPPVTCRRVVREGLSKNIGALGDMYALGVAGFESGRKDQSGREDDLRPSEVDGREFRQTFLEALVRLRTISGKMAFCKLEPNLLGPWPQRTYETLILAQSQILAAASIMGNAYTQLDAKWCRVLTSSNVYNSAFLADVFSMFAHLRNSLRTGTPLPPLLPIFDRLEYHGIGRVMYSEAKKRHGHHRHHGRHRREHSAHSSQHTLGEGEGLRSRVKGSDGGTELGPAADWTVAHGRDKHDTHSPPRSDDSSTTAQDMDAEEEMDETERADKALISMLGGLLTWDNLKEEEFAAVATALVSQVQMIAALDTMHRCVLDLVGVKDVAAFDMGLERWTIGDQA